MNASPSQERPEPPLIDAARRAIVKHGYAGLTLERIAAEADVSRVTLHRRGFSKEEIFDTVIRQMREQQRDALWPALAADGTGAERLRLGLETICDVCERDLDLMLAIRAQIDAARHGETAELDSHRIVIDPIQILARDGIADGSLRAGDPETVAILIVNWAGWTYVHLRTALAWKRKRAHETVITQTMAAFEAH